jgi:hypothetical protein
MPHTFESAKTGRSKCRACTQSIAAGSPRFGERLPNPFADEGGETTHWYHVRCAAFTRPEAFLEGLGAVENAGTVAELIDDSARAELARAAQNGVTYRRLPRVAGANRAPSGRAACRGCKEPIPKGSWRIALDYYDEGRFAPSGFIHLSCARSYLETTDILDRVRHFSPELGEAELDEIESSIG